MKFIVSNCRVIDAGKKSSNRVCKVTDNNQARTYVKEDLGVLVTRNFKVGKRCNVTCDKAHKMEVYICRNFDYKSASIIQSVRQPMHRVFKSNLVADRVGQRL